MTEPTAEQLERLDTIVANLPSYAPNTDVAALTALLTSYRALHTLRPAAEWRDSDGTVIWWSDHGPFIGSGPANPSDPHWSPLPRNPEVGNV